MAVFSVFNAKHLDAGVLPAATPTALPVDAGIQSNKNGCWAYVASAISSFYSPGSTWTPCALMNEVYGNAVQPRFDCCGNCSDQICDQPKHVVEVLSGITHNLREPAIDNGLTAEVIRAELAHGSHGSPICVRFVWAGEAGLGHAFVITGIDKNTDGEDRLYVYDPAPNVGASTWMLSDLAMGFYHKPGQWKQTFLTQAPPHPANQGAPS